MDSLYKIKDKPEYTNGCEHKEKEYVGTIRYFDHNNKLSWLDVYVFDNMNKQEMCIRYGNEPQEYYSPGYFIEMIRVSIQNEIYGLALKVLKEKGTFTFVKNPVIKN